MELRHTVACEKCGKSLISCQSYEDTDKIINIQKSSCCNAPYNYIGLQVVQNDILTYSKKKDGVLEVTSVDNSKRNKASKVIAIEDLKNSESPKKRGRPARVEETQEVQALVVEEPKRKGRPAKAESTPIIQTPVAEVTKKRGRPAKAETPVAEAIAVETPKRRGRPPQSLETPVVKVVVDESPKKRGRPKNTTSLADIDKIVEQEIKNEVPKRRGRPKATPVAQVEEPVEHITVKRGRRQAG